jgi:hypothetical protein
MLRALAWSEHDDVRIAEDAANEIERLVERLGDAAYEANIARLKTMALADVFHECRRLGAIQEGSQLLEVVTNIARAMTEGAQ